MVETEIRQGGVGAFFTSVPGILTGLAALVTAAVGGYATWHLNQSSSDRNLGSATAPAPSGPASIDLSSLRLSTPTIVVNQVANRSDPLEAAAEQCDGGSASSCAQMLDLLSEQCFEGIGFACNALYELSPVGSDWEAYGATCGDRFDVSAADTCDSR